MHTQNYNKSVWWHFFVALVIFALSYWSSDKLSLKDIQSLLGVLQNTSSMVFAISGIWIAYLYPQAVAAIVKGENTLPKEVSKDSEISRIRLIVGVVAISATVMGLLIIFSLIVPIIQNAAFYSVAPHIFKGIGFGFIFTLTYAQLFAVYVVLASNVSFLIDLSNMKTKRKLEQKLNPTRAVKSSKSE